MPSTDRPQLERTRAALVEWDAHEARLDAVAHDDAAFGAWRAQRHVLGRAVAVAYYEDTSDRNRLDTCEQHMRPDRASDALVWLRRQVLLAPRPCTTQRAYLPWAEAGGPNECAHGYAEGIPCPRCEAATPSRGFVQPDTPATVQPLEYRDPTPGLHETCPHGHHPYLLRGGCPVCPKPPGQADPPVRR